MVRHIFLIRFHDKHHPYVQEYAQYLRDLASMNLYKGLIATQVGFDESGRDDAFDMVYISDFETMEDLLVYNTHPGHKAHFSEAAPYIKETGAIDYVL